jgi:hypothetical protein
MSPRTRLAVVPPFYSLVVIDSLRPYVQHLHFPRAQPEDLDEEHAYNGLYQLRFVYRQHRRYEVHLQAWRSGEYCWCVRGWRFGTCVFEDVEGKCVLR